MASIARKVIMTIKSAGFDLGGYRIIEEIARNLTTVVYRALVNGLELGADNSTVIIKLLSSTDPTAQELVNFCNQYTISKNLELPGVLRVYSLEEFGTDLCQRGYALVMEDFEGVSLELERDCTLPLGDVLKIGVQLADTLHALGQQRIIHKDIKPANILINHTTKQVKLIDFGIASLLPRETSEILNPNQLEGTLAYISPEQTGRMNRGIDYRTDFYALGVTLYQLLTGKLPFETTNSIELVHCHLAQIAIPIDRVNPKIPIVVAQIVAKLMAKNAEDRYQSGLGLKSDLNECLQQLQQTGDIGKFTIGQRDISDRFIIPDKLYGREAEVETLLEAFTRVSQGQTELILIAGSSGIGKTAVINQIHKPIVRRSGYFIKGKYDQFNRDIPFSALVQAFRDLLRQLFSESDRELAEWKSKILAAVGKNGRVLLEVIPELMQIIGDQPPVPELVGIAQQNRLNLLLQKFVRVFATAAHPLTLCLDDLQWADSASLKSIELLLSGTEYLLLLGAYRDNEVGQVHPLMLTLQQLAKTEAIVKTIRLAPLGFNHINQLVADTFHCDLATAKPLTQSIDLKTKGNPFFTAQFLKALYTDGEITFNPDGYWECDLVNVQSLAITDDLIKFMAEQLEKLPIKTQQVLKLAACIGNRFDLDTLKTVSAQSHLDTATALWQGLQAGLILPTSQIYKFYQDLQAVEDDVDGVPFMLRSSPIFPLRLPSSSYRFLHDRVQQAAYSLIPEHHKRSNHLKIAQLLSANTPNIEQSDRLLEIVNHFNLATHLQQDMMMDLIEEAAQREHLAQLNLRAAQKARASTAYAAAFNYARIGTEILGSLGWKTQYRLTLNLHEILAEAAFLNGDLEIVPKLVQVVLDRVQTPLDRVKTYEIIVQYHSLQKQYQQAIDRGVEILHQLGVKLSLQTNQLSLLQEIIKTQIALRGKSTEQLLALPEISNPAHRSPLRILDLLLMPAFFSSRELMVVLATTGIRLTLRNGNTPWAASFYGTYAIVLSDLDKLQQSYQLGQVAMVLGDRFGDLAIVAKTKATLPWFSQLWQQHFHTAIATADECIPAAMDSGNLTFLGIGAYTSMLIRFYAGIPLDEIVAKIPEIKQVIAHSKDESSQQLFEIYQERIFNLHHNAIISVHPLEMSDDLGLLDQQHDRQNSTMLATIYSGKTILAYLFEDIPVALKYADRLMSHQVTGIVQASIFDPLTRLAAYPSSDKLLKKQLLNQVNITQQKLAKRAQLMPENFQHKYDLVTAEKCRVLGDFAQAIELYNRAIAGAKKSKYLHEEAIANECAAKFYRDWGKEQIAVNYLQSAYYCYSRWGAKAKTDALEQKYPELRYRG
jgi:predicted ATPase